MFDFCVVSARTRATTLFSFIMRNKLVIEEDLKHFHTSLLTSKEDAKGLLNIKQEVFKELNLVAPDSFTAQLPEDAFASALIPTDFCGGKEVLAVKAADNGDCLYNATSIALCGDESLALLLRLLVSGELFFNAKYYAEHSVFSDASGDTGISVNTLFSIALNRQAEKKFSDTQDNCEAVKVQALSSCAVGEWSSFLNILALASVISRPLFSVYPDVNFRYRKLLHRIVMPRISPESEIPPDQVNILWSRAGGFDNRPGTWFEPNHFVPIINKWKANDKGIEKHEKMSKKPNTVKKKSQSTLFSFQKKLTTTHQTTPSKLAQKRTVDMAALEDCSKAKKKPEPSAPNVAQKRKFLPRWKEEFPWLVFSEENNCMTCSICLQVPWVAGKSQFLSGSNSFKKETIQLHGSSNGHIRAMTALRTKQNPVAHSSIARSFAKGQRDQEERDQKEMVIKMNTAYFVAKEELPFSKYEGLLSLQKKNGLEINMTYANDKSCAKMVSVIGNVYKDLLTDEITRTNYISVMADGATDTGGLENETVYARFIRDGRPVNRLVGHRAVEHATAEGN